MPVNLALRVDPAVQFTCIDCMGSPEALSLSQAPAGAPLYSYSNHTYTGNFGDTPSFEQWGKLVSIKIDVTKPYTGSKKANPKPAGNAPYKQAQREFYENCIAKGGNVPE